MVEVPPYKCGFPVTRQEDYEVTHKQICLLNF